MTETAPSTNNRPRQPRPVVSRQLRDNLQMRKRLLVQQAVMEGDGQANGHRAEQCPEATQIWPRLPHRRSLGALIDG